MRVRTRRIAASPMETRGVLAHCIGEQITIWSSTQIPHVVRNSVAAHIGVPEWQGRVVMAHVGGGFGCKVQGYCGGGLLAARARGLEGPVPRGADPPADLVGAP